MLCLFKRGFKGIEVATFAAFRCIHIVEIIIDHYSILHTDALSGDRSRDRGTGIRRSGYAGWRRGMADRLSLRWEEAVCFAFGQTPQALPPPWRQLLPFLFRPPQ